MFDWVSDALEFIKGIFYDIVIWFVDLASDAMVSVGLADTWNDLIQTEAIETLNALGVRVPMDSISGVQSPARPPSQSLDVPERRGSVTPALFLLEGTPSPPSPRTWPRVTVSHIPPRPPVDSPEKP